MRMECVQLLQGKSFRRNAVSASQFREQGKWNELNILRWTRCVHSIADDGRAGTGALTTGGRAVALCEVGTDGLRLHSLPDEQRQCNHRRRLE